ncbi:MAG: K+/H+ antiporter subunit F [Casimicrobiaceae bacterium]|nr:K+/H+ antiporter subunit F [Casimicrobiaceae bacterium]MCX8098684.1 K+/H+ antiporter subunit F [Casimicrobiaceae bacterium]
MITAQLLPYAIGLFALAMLLNLYRLLRGPSLPDRILALDTLYVNALALVVLMGLQFGLSLYFEAALLIAMLGFVSTVVAAKFLLRGEVFR